MGLHSRISSSPRPAICCQGSEFPHRDSFPNQFLALLQTLPIFLLHFQCGTQKGCPLSRKARPAQGWLWRKGLWAYSTESWGTGTRWARSFSCARETVIWRSLAQGQETLLPPEGSPRPSSSSCKAPRCGVLSRSYGQLTFGAGTRLAVHPREYDHKRVQGKSTCWLVYEKTGGDVWQTRGNIKHLFSISYELSRWLKMFPFLILRTEVPRANRANESLSRIIYGNIKRVPDTQCSQAKPIISAPDNLNIQEISDVPLGERNDLMANPNSLLLPVASGSSGTPCFG